MIKNYFKTAIRNIKRYSAHSILNIIGLAIGMVCAILLLLWVQYQLSYDRFHKNADCLYRVLERHYSDGKLQQLALTTYPLADALKEEYPEIIRTSRYQNFWESYPKGDDIVEGTLATVDKDFFEMFNIVFVLGDKKGASSGPYNIVITEDMANRYFGDEDPLGKAMTVWPNYIFTVTGVIKNVPRNSHFYIDCLVPSEFLEIKTGASLSEWNQANNYTFIELIEGADSKLVEEKIKGIIQRNLKGSDAENLHSEIFLQNLKNIHLYSQGKYALDIESGNIFYVRLAILIALVILTIACINFMNLFTAQSSRRAKEIGLRKVAGADRQKIVSQFLGESMLIVLVSMVIAMILVELLLPGFNILMRTGMQVNYKSAGLYIVLITVILFCGLMAGSYPAFYLSSYEPINIMKGVIKKDSGNARFRRILVVIQFTLSFLFIICTLIIGAQLRYIRNKNLGLDIDNVCRFSFSDINRETLKKDISNNPDIVSISFTSQNTVSFRETTTAFEWEGKKEGDRVVFNILNADEDYAVTFKPELRKGRFFSSDFSTDKTTIVINESAAEIIGYKDPIGEYLSYNGLNYRIIGVLKDFNFQSLHSKITPLVIMLLPPAVTSGICNIRMKPDHITSTVSYIRNIFKSYNLNFPLNIGFLDDDFNFQYMIEQIIGTTLGYLTFLALIISCLGLLGLSTFMTVRRTKEIGIRKANGAKSIEIFSLLSKEYISLVVISFLIASPVAWFAMNMWLRSFAYRINTGWWIFALALVITIAITILTVGFQSYKAARINPVEALRYE